MGRWYNLFTCFTVCGEKQFSILLDLQQMLLFLFPVGCRENRLRLCHYLYALQLPNQEVKVQVRMLLIVLL